MTTEDRGPTGAPGGAASLGPRLVAACPGATRAALLIVSALRDRPRRRLLRHRSGRPSRWSVAIGLLVLVRVFALRTTSGRTWTWRRRGSRRSASPHWPTGRARRGRAAGLRHGARRDPARPIEMPEPRVPLGDRPSSCRSWPAILGSRELAARRDRRRRHRHRRVLRFTEFLGVRLPAGILDLRATDGRARRLIGGFGTALTPENLLFAAVGVTARDAGRRAARHRAGADRGAAAAADLQLRATGAFIMFAGIYYGGMYGGSTTSILLNTPGESASVVTTIEGFQMAKRGRGGAALATAAIGSFVAGTISTVADHVPGARSSPGSPRTFQPADYFALMVVAFVSVTALVGRSLVRGPGQPVPGPVHRPHRHRRPDRPAAIHVRRPAAARRDRHRGRGGRPVRRRGGAVRGLAAASLRRRRSCRSRARCS